MDIFGVAQVVLIILKLFDLITWSWWAVLTPFWLWMTIVCFMFWAYMRR